MTEINDLPDHPVASLTWEYLCDETIYSSLPLVEQITYIANELSTRHPELFNFIYDKMSTKSKRSPVALAKRAILVGTVTEGGSCGWKYRIEEVR